MWERLWSDPCLLYFSQLSLTAIFALSALGKFRAWDKFAAALRDYQILPEFAVIPTARLLPFLELAVALAILLEGVRTQAALGAIVLLAAFSFALSFNLLKGRREIDCGCFGPGHKQQLSWALVARNGFLLVLALPALWHTSANRSAHWLDLLTAIFGAAAILLLNLCLGKLSSRIHQLQPQAVPEGDG